MLEIFQYTFMKNAAIAGVLVGLLCSVLSVYVVLKRMAFIGQGIAHAAFGGIAFGVLLGLDIYLSTTVFCVLVAILIGIVSRKGRISEDSSIGLFLTTSMAVGVILLNFRKEYTQDIFSYLFGSILSVTPEDVYKVAVIGAIVLALLIYFHRQLQFFTFDEESARVANVPVTFLYYLLLVILAVVIVLSVQLVGVILVSALLITPATIALLIGRRFLTVMLIASAIGVFSVLSGLITSYYARISTGPAIVAVLFIIFIIVFAVNKLAGRQS